MVRAGRQHALHFIIFTMTIASANYCNCDDDALLFNPGNPCHTHALILCSSYSIWIARDCAAEDDDGIGIIGIMNSWWILI